MTAEKDDPRHLRNFCRSEQRVARAYVMALQAMPGVRQLCKDNLPHPQDSELYELYGYRGFCDKMLRLGRGVNRQDPWAGANEFWQGQLKKMRDVKCVRRARTLESKHELAEGITVAHVMCRRQGGS